MISVNLTPEIARKLLRYDPDTGMLFWKERAADMFVSKNAIADRDRWNSRMAGSPAFGKTDKYGYRCGVILGRQYLAHRIIWMIVHGWLPEQIDHQNGVRSDNRLINLRSVSRHENAKNRKLQSNNRTGHTGISIDPKNSKWIASIKSGRKSIRLGSFDSLDQAVSARKAAERRLGFHENHGSVRAHNYRNRNTESPSMQVQ